MFGYRNAVYNPYQRQVDLYTWDADGKRIMTSLPSYPYFYYEDNHGPEQSIFSTTISKKSFDTIFDRTKFIKERGLRRLFDNLNPVQQSLIDLFCDKNDTDDFTKFPLKIHFIDIEAVGANGFSKPENPNDPINVITVYDSLDKHFYVWGSDPYETDADDLTYYHFQSETRMLDHFVDFISQDVPDILSGWYSEGYDIPYIINRIERVLGEGESKRLSPYNKIRTRNFLGKFGKMETNYIIEGISTVDYKDIYIKFCPVKRESYKLDHVAQVELNETKVDYGDQSLYEFRMKDWKTFVDYNIQDVRLLARLEEKNQYIQLLRLLAYAGLTTFQAALGTVGIVTGAAAIEARKRNQRLYTQVVNEQDERSDFEGGFVFDPVPGHHKAIASFDATSLYPSTMISLNTSPETKMGKILEILPNKILIRNRDGIILEMTQDEFNRFIKKEKIAISRAKVLFTQKKKGILADLVDKFFKKRVACRKEHKEIQQTINSLSGDDIINAKNRMEQLDTKQQAIKIFINSVYGACGNKYCSIGDTDIAESITLTGQAVIKESREIFKRFVNKETGLTSQEDLERGLIAGDTDSLYISINQMVSKFSENGKVTKEAYDVVDKFHKFLNENMRKWAVGTLNTIDCRFDFKRENLCDAGIFLMKKRYVLHVLDKEGFQCDSWKYTGIDVVSTKMPNTIKPYVRMIIEDIVMNKSEQSANSIFKDAYNKFVEMDIPEISQVSGIANLEKYSMKCSGFSTAKHMPRHVKAAYYYNLLLDELGLDKKYEKIISGDKIKYFDLEVPNMYSIDVIAYKNKYPNEFRELFKPDMNEMFEKDMYKCIERFYNVMNWMPRKPTDQLKLTLDDLFS